MAIVEVRELTERGGSISDDASREYMRTFRVITTSAADGTRTVRLAPGLPKLYDPYRFGAELDRFAFCVSVEPEQDQDFPFTWKVKCKYSSRQDKPQAQQNENPLLRAPDVSWEMAEYSKPFVRDLTGRAVLNSSDETFDPTPETEDSRPTLIITRNELAYRPAMAKQYQDAVNTDLFYGATARQAKFKKITGVQKFENGIVFFSVTYEIQFRREGFLRYIMDQGFRADNGVIIRDVKNAQPLANASLLDGQGKPLVFHQDRYRNPVDTLTKATKSFLVSYTPPKDKDTVIQGMKVKLPAYDVNSDVRLRQYQVQMDDEIMTVTKIVPNGAGDGFAVSVIRGQAGTLPAVHAINTTVKLLPVYLGFREFRELPFKVWRL